MVGVDFRGGECQARLEMADHKRDFLGDEAVGDVERLFQLAAVVGGDDNELLPVHAARCVDIGRRLFCAIA